MPQFTFKFSTTHDFEYAAGLLQKYCGISRELASKRLHILKEEVGKGGDDNVRFDRSGNVFDPETGDLLGSLTLGGAKEKA